VAAPEGGHRGDTVTYKILVVDDSSTMRSLLVSTLEDLTRFQITETNSGFEALRFLSQQKPDLIITDINMPDINGLELVSFVKRNPLYRAIPLIIVTTERSEKDRIRGLALGAEEYLEKPFDPGELQAMVRRHLHLGGAPAGARGRDR
jgi:two-component system chemotaxis response regulator CheY